MAERVNIKVDYERVKRLGDDFREVAEVYVRRATLRGEELVRREIVKAKKDQDPNSNLAQGVSSDIKEAAGGLLKGEISVSARSGRRGARAATVHYASGKTKAVRLRPQPAFNYAEVFARGKGAQLAPKSAKVFLVPVDDVPTLDGKAQTYVQQGDQKYVMRPQIKAVPPTDYDLKAAKQLEAEAEAIFDSAARAVLEGDDA
jgi:hypothetical protein